MGQAPSDLIIVEQAKEEDLELVMELIAEASAWLHSIGVDYQWPSPPPRSSWDRARHGIAEREVYLVRLRADGRTVGTYRFEWVDRYGAWKDYSDDAGYMRGLVTHSSARGMGVGVAMLQWAREHIRSHNRKFMRLRCCAINPFLVQYYASNGFAFCGVAPGQLWPSALFQAEL